MVAAAADSLFVDRVEVLRGPQGTLYGRNSIGGAINSVSRRPTDTFYAEGRATIGNYSTYNGEGAISGPLTQNIQGRLAFFDNNQNDGYFTNLSGDKSEGGRGNSQYIEAQLQSQVTSHFDVWAKLAYYRNDNSYRATNTLLSYEYAPFPPGVLSPTPGYGLTVPGVVTQGPLITANPGNANNRNIDTNTPDRANLGNDILGDLQATYHLPFADVKYIGGYNIYRYNLVFDADGTAVNSYPFAATSGLGYPPLMVYPTEQENYRESKQYYSNELDLSSTGNSPLQYILGFYQYHESFDQPVNLIQPQQTQIFTPYMSAANPSGDIYHTDQSIRTNSYATFAQLDYKIDDHFKVTGGVRYTKDQKYGSESFRAICLGLPTCGAPAAMYGAYTPAIDISSALISTVPSPGVDRPVTFNAATGDYGRRLAGQWGAVTGTAGLEWTPDTHTLAYLKYSRGYKSGGFNGGAILPNPETLPETINAYEAGVKEVVSRSLQVNVALFDYDYNNLQDPLTVLPAVGPEQTLLFNLSQSRSYGAELETTWQATPDLRFLLSYAYLNARITSTAPLQDAVQPTLGLRNLDGQNLPESPHSKVAVNGTYTWRFDPGDLSLSVDYIFKDQSYDSVFDQPYYLAPSYSQFDARFVYNDRQDRFTIIAYGKNLNNAQGYDNVTASFLQSPAAGSPNYTEQADYIIPRTYGVQLQVRFR